MSDPDWFDLHTHSAASDGISSVTENVRAAGELGLEDVGVTTTTRPLASRRPGRYLEVNELKDVRYWPPTCASPDRRLDHRC